MLAAAAGSAAGLDVCQQLLSQGYPLPNNTFDAAACSGRRELCEWLLSAGCAWSGGASAAAARSGHVELLAWLLESCRAGGATPYGGARSGRWVDRQSLLCGVAEGCNLSTLQQVVAQWGDGNGEAAGGNGAPQPQLQGQEQGQGQGQDVLTGEAKERVVAAAAVSATPDWRAKLAWLVEACGYPRSSKACVRAAACGDAQDRLRWLRANGFGWGAGAPVGAAGPGAAQGAGLHSQLEAAVLLLVQRGDVGALELLVEWQPHDALELLGSCGAVAAAGSGQLHVLRWLTRRLGAGRGTDGGQVGQGGGDGGGGGGGGGVFVVPQEALVAAARGGHMDVVAWLLRVCEAGRGAAAAGAGARAADKGEAAGVAVARPPGCELFAAAAQSGRVELVEWLAARGCRAEVGVRMQGLSVPEGDIQEHPRRRTARMSFSKGEN